MDKVLSAKEPLDAPITGRDVEEIALPQYSEDVLSSDPADVGIEAQANVTEDGRVNISLDQRTPFFSRNLVSELKEQMQRNAEEKWQPPSIEQVLGREPQPPRLNIVMHVVGSRGDVQPFIAVGQVLKEKYKHNVRLATHPIFKSFVEGNGLDFFSIGGDPAQLMAFMVRSPGLLPSMDQLRGGDIGRHREIVYRIMEGCWRSCVEAGDGMVEGHSDSRLQYEGHEPPPYQKSTKPFVADVIIANPPSFAHIHCAQKLGIPLHLMFTMPWSPTQAFPHPLANIKPSNADKAVVNYVSYALVETVFWQGLGSIINRFREKALGLESLRLAFGPRMASKLKIPYTYCWSPSLIPKPRDWGSHISVAGFYFLPLAANYTPDAALSAFLAAGPPPIYIGFGSIVVSDVDAITTILFTAIKTTGQRALVSRGWGGLGSQTCPEHIFIIGDVPHDWLFPRVSCVVHHGGAGTTAAAIAAGKPSVVVPFFGDQAFWGMMVWRAGVGSLPIAARELTAGLLAAAIQEALQPVVVDRAVEVGQAVAAEKGSEIGALSFHNQLDFERMRCQLVPQRVAVWQVRRSDVRLSTFAATTLLNARLLRIQDIKLYRHQEYDLECGPWDPITGVISACLGMVGNMTKSLSDVPMEVSKAQKANPHNGNSLRESANIASGAMTGFTKGIGRILLAGFRSPFEVTLSAARGFHNAPLLYGDETVRPLERITGIRSGIEAAGKGLGLGVYDGVAGLFQQPAEGARKEGPLGFAKGLGKGLGGVVLKPIAAVWGVPGYTFEGINKECQKFFGSSSKSHIALARLAQGSEELNHMSEEEIRDVVERWHQIQAESFEL